MGASAPPTIYLSGENNFRFAIATVKEYKANRAKLVKPWHYKNIKAHLIGAYGAIVVDGMEADDAMSIHQMNALKECRQTIICSRDKDMRMIPGCHYSWEMHLQPSWGPCYVFDPGQIFPCTERGKLEGTGIAWFFAQLLMGDPVDNIPGLPRMGPQGTYKLLKDAHDEEEMYEIVHKQYKKMYGDEADERMLEQGQLLWIIREMKDEPVMWELK